MRKDDSLWKHLHRCGTRKVRLLVNCEALSAELSGIVKNVFSPKKQKKLFWMEKKSNNVFLWPMKIHLQENILDLRSSRVFPSHWCLRPAKKGLCGKKHIFWQKTVFDRNVFEHGRCLRLVRFFFLFHNLWWNCLPSIWTRKAKTIASISKFTMGCWIHCGEKLDFGSSLVRMKPE